MAEPSGLSDRFPKASPWPMLVAVGFVLLEIGLLVGIFPIAVGGVLLFGGSVAGILTESGYVAHLWATLARAGVLFCLLGAGLIYLQGTFDVAGLLAAVETPNVAGNRLASRGVAAVLGGAVLVALGATRQIAEPTAR